MSFIRTVFVLVAASTCGALVISLLLLPAHQASRGPTEPATLVGLEPVDAHVREYAVAPSSPREPTRAITTRARRVTGYATVGVTWTGHTPEDLHLAVRTEVDGVGWAPWQALPPGGPDTGHRPGRDEAIPGETRTGTAALAVGEVDRVQLRVSGTLPEDLTLAVIDPGESITTEIEESDEASLAAGPPNRPTIRTRAQWGANERLRDGSPDYGTIRGGFVHHTVSGNSYSPAEVPAIIRGIYAYHTRSLGWSDIGYNFLVDRFGRIWEGRYGGIGRPVIGAHTYGYNDVAFAMSAIGNFETTRPTRAMLRAFGRLFRWKLRSNGIAPRSTQRLNGRRFPAISGHRDAGSTACPGRYLYAELDTIRDLAATAPSGSGKRPPLGRGVVRDLTGDGRLDLIARKARSGELVVFRDLGTPGIHFERIPTGRRADDAGFLQLGGDWTGDGRSDLIGKSRTSGDVWIRPGKGGTRLGKPRILRRGWLDRGDLVATLDLTGDRRPDLLARGKKGRVYAYPSNGHGGMRKPRRMRDHLFVVDRVVPAGYWNGDRVRDLVVRHAKSKRLYVVPGTSGGKLGKPVALTRPFTKWRRLIGVGDVNDDGHPDLMGVRSDRLWLLRGTAKGLRPPRDLGIGVRRFDLIG